MRTILDLPTPCLLVDVDRLETNIRTLADFARSVGRAVRPHAKTHKSHWVAERQIAHGAVGLTVATPWEAEVFAPLGAGLFLARSVAGAPSIRRLVSLKRAGGDLILSTDSVDGARELSAAFDAAGLQAPVRIEIDVGQARCGVRPEQARALAREIDGLAGLRLEGVFTHEGHVYSVEGPDALPAFAQRVANLMAGVAADLTADGHGPLTVSVGATPSRYEIAKLEGITELRPGSYVYYDRTHVLLGAADESDCAATILTTVISVPNPGQAVVDAGRKALGSDGIARECVGVLPDQPRADFRRASEEHGLIDWPEDEPPPRVGDRFRVIPFHVCTAVNLPDEIVLVRGDEVVGFEPIEARGYGRISEAAVWRGPIRPVR